MAVNVRVQDEDDDEPGWTELQLAAANGDLARVEALVKSGSEDVNEPASGYYGRTALQAACLGRHEDVVEVLLAEGAEVDAAGGNNSMRTALQLACGDADNQTIVHRLLAAGANVNAPAQRYNGRTALQAAAELGAQGRDTVVLLLGLGADVNAPPSTTAGRTALQAACSSHDMTLVRLLIEEGAHVNAPACKNKGVTALQAACLSNSPIIVDMLLAAGADPDAAGSSFRGGTALHAAAHMGHIEVVRKLLAAGANPNVTAGPAYQTPLQTAQLRDQKTCARIIAEAGGITNGTRARFLFEC